MSGGISATTVMMGASLALAAGGTAMQVMGQQQQAAAQASAANYQAQVARNAQAVAKMNSDNALKVGLISEDRQRAQTSLIEGKQRASLASQGGDITDGSAVDIIGDTARAGESDALTIRSNAARQAWGYEVAGAGYGAQAGLSGMQAANATANLPFGIGSSLLGGASSVANKWSMYQQGNPGSQTYSSIDDLMAAKGIS